ncbi:hypothetical protein [Moorena sp. SIO4G3]|uniref:plasmid mobilization protein n=1 Tax=Moorena sp. SIO4G3 TaxID=2607821 RepID=UPI00142B9C4D|nr:hypothetical protein [Moorena sp. SIO4G3]NEO79967.1 ribbon-helix-helix protein, CopG family [Moorena sp. SIO4G3]
MKTIKMTIRLTEYEKKKLEQEAERIGMNQSELLRSLIARFPERAPRRLCRIQSVPDWCQAFHSITGLSFLETRALDSGALINNR